jgi:hypothetical protein
MLMLSCDSKPDQRDSGTPKVCVRPSNILEPHVQGVLCENIFALIHEAALRSMQNDTHQELQQDPENKQSRQN